MMDKYKVSFQNFTSGNVRGPGDQLGKLLCFEVPWGEVVNFGL